MYKSRSELLIHWESAALARPPSPLSEDQLPAVGPANLVPERERGRKESKNEEIRKKCARRAGQVTCRTLKRISSLAKSINFILQRVALLSSRASVPPFLVGARVNQTDTWNEASTCMEKWKEE